MATAVPSDLRWVTVKMRGSDGIMKPIGVWVSTDDEDIFKDFLDSDGDIDGDEIFGG